MGVFLETRLHKACFYGNIKIFNSDKKYYDFFQDINTLNFHGQTPIFLAIFKNNLQIVRILIEQNADLKVVDNNGLTPLELAIKHHRNDIVRLFAELTNLCDFNLITFAKACNNHEAVTIICVHSSTNVRCGIVGKCKTIRAMKKKLILSGRQDLKN